MAKQEFRREQERVKSVDLGDAPTVPEDPGVTLKAVMHTSRGHSSRRPVAREPGQFSSIPELKQQCVHGSSDLWSTHPISVQFAQDFELRLCRSGR